ncbi:zinc finger and BTB domain-containing protein 17-like isoform X2 [Branchiostoma floridae]|uniref:Zinc finger and BTB domain-containing protein 17-like isoform X2 n=1 Tax=Branchiostoma floridae TaxID=7739 RepID=A0A9J7LBT9_BRAFL|nr:zinc finger and BTB domain-containing protein 17-like isoform X2 [Branchiostoma floridae]
MHDRPEVYQRARARAAMMSGWRDSARESALFHPHTVLRQLNAFRHHNLHCDVTINVAGTRFRCHRAVLAANSVFFHHLLLPGDSSVLPSNREQCYHLEWMGAPTFSALLQYMYTSQLFLSDERTARELLHGARRVGLLALGDLVADYLLDTDTGEDRAEPSDGEEGGDPPSGNVVGEGGDLPSGDDVGEGGAPVEVTEKEDPTFKLEILEPVDTQHQEPAEPGYNWGSEDALPQEPADKQPQGPADLGCKLNTVPQEPAEPGYNIGSVNVQPQEPADKQPQEPADQGYNIGTVNVQPQEPASPGCMLDNVPQEPASKAVTEVPSEVPSEAAEAVEETDQMDQVMTCLQNLSQMFSTNGRQELDLVTANSSDHIRHDSSCVLQSAPCRPPAVGQGQQRPGNAKEQRLGNSDDLNEERLGNSDDLNEERLGNSDDFNEERLGNSDDSKEQRLGNSDDSEEQRLGNSDDPEGQRLEKFEEPIRKRGRMEEEWSHCQEVWSARKRPQRRHVCHQTQNRKENMKSLPLKVPRQCPDCRQTSHRWKDWSRHCHRHQIRKGHIDRRIYRHLVQKYRVPFRCTKCES